MARRSTAPTRPFDLAQFDLREMLRCGSDLSAVTSGAASVEEAARAVTAYLFEAARHPVDGPRSCALVRCFVTSPLGSLDAELQQAARAAAGGTVLSSDINCLVLLASIGDEPAWCDRRRSAAHRAIPLASAEGVRAAPMIARLIHAFGVRIEDIVGHAAPERVLHATTGKTYGVFHVANAPGSPYIPAQREFVEPYRIRSVVGFGCALATGNVIAVVMFSRTDIPERCADRFRNVALDLRSCLHRFGAKELFAGPVDPAAPPVR